MNRSKLYYTESYTTHTHTYTYILLHIVKFGVIYTVICKSNPYYVYCDRTNNIVIHMELHINVAL